MQDEELLLRQLRDHKTRETAFTRLVHLYQETLYWPIRRIVLTHENADDVLQNVFVKAWRGLPEFKGDSRISTWLYRIAVNESINYMKRKRTDNAVTDENVANLLQADPYFDGDATQQLLQQAVNKLPERQRQVFTLRYFEQIPYEEMSKMLNTSVGALKASYHHAVQKVTAFFENND